VAKDAPLTYHLDLPEKIWSTLSRHLFAGDNDEHGAVIAASVARVGGRVRLLARHVRLAVDGVDYVNGERGYRMLTANFVRDQAIFCREERLAYLAVHNHGGRARVQFSRDDLRSHERGYPALKDITRGQIVGGVVFAENAVAGDLWLESERTSLTSARIIGQNHQELFPEPPRRPPAVSPNYDRQARLFGDRGQAMLAQQRVGIIGLGGVGSLVCEYLVRVGVGSIIAVDPDRLDLTNLSRVVGSTQRDALVPSAGARKSSWLKTRLGRIARLKVDVAAREARKVNSRIEFVRYARNVAEDSVARALLGCDFLFLAADSMQARLVFNAIVHQYLIPGVQLGAKVPVDPTTGAICRVYSVVRPVLPGQGCLWCNGLITPDGLQKEALSPDERRAQRYVEEEDLPAPSVITLNALSASHATNYYLFRLMGLRNATTSDYMYIEPRSDVARLDAPRSDPDCSECTSAQGGRLAAGDSMRLPTQTAVRRNPRSGRRKP